MGSPTLKSNYAAEGLSLLTSQYKLARPITAPPNPSMVVAALLRAWSAGGALVTPVVMAGAPSTMPWVASASMTASSGAAWQPKNATSATCVLQLDADVGVTASGGNVSSWADQSGAGLVTAATQSASAQQPTLVTGGGDFGGKNYLTFGGTQALTLGNVAFMTSAGTVGARAISKNAAQYVPIIGKTNGAFCWMLGNDYLSSSSGLANALFGGYGGICKSNAAYTNVDSQLIATYDGSTSLLYVANAVQSTSGSYTGPLPTTGDAVVIGAQGASGSYGFTGSVRRIAIFSGVLSSTERAQLNTWLGS